MPDDIQATVDKKELRELIADVLELPVDEVADRADFNRNLGAYSRLAMEIIVRLEERYGIKLAESELVEITSLNRVHGLLTAKLQEAPS